MTKYAAADYYIPTMHELESVVDLFEQYCIDDFFYADALRYEFGPDETTFEETLIH